MKENVNGVECSNKSRLPWLKPELQVLEISEMTDGKSNMIPPESGHYAGPS